MQKVILGAGDGVNVQQKSLQINCGRSRKEERNGE